MKGKKNILGDFFFCPFGWEHQGSIEGWGKKIICLWWNTDCRCEGEKKTPSAVKKI